METAHLHTADNKYLASVKIPKEIDTVFWGGRCFFTDTGSNYYVESNAYFFATEAFYDPDMDQA